MNACRIIRVAVRAAVIAMVALLAATSSPQAQSQNAQASIGGVVVNAATNQPVSGAVVELTGIERGRVVSHSVITRGDGKFELRNLPPASGYQLTATESDDYLPAAYGQHSLSDPWTPIALSAGQDLADIRLTLTPVSSITGRIVDGAGKPHRRADVFVLRATYSEGRRVLQQAAHTQTTDQGEYFVGRLGTGQYYIRANPINNSEYRQLFESPIRWDALKDQKAAEPEGFPTTYYPNTTDLAAAKPIDLLDGGQAKDINLIVTKVRTHRVSGVVDTGSGVPSAAAATVRLVPHSAGLDSSFTRRVSANQAGQFDFRGVLPGSYYLIAVVTAGNTQMTARQTVQVDSDLAKLSITVVRGYSIPGTIRFADWERGMPPDYSQLAVNLVPDITAPIDRTFSGFRAVVNSLAVVPSPDGAFVCPNVAPGDYRVVITLSPKLAADAKIPLDLRAAYMRSVMLGNNDVLTGGIHLDSNPDGPLQIVIATDSGSIFGRVLDDQQTAVPERMIIAPDLPHRQRMDLFSPIPVSVTGRFTLDGIPPGDYKLFAWAHVENGAWLDPQFMRVYEDRGTPVHIEASGSYPVEVPLIH